MRVGLLVASCALLPACGNTTFSNASDDGGTNRTDGGGEGGAVDGGSSLCAGSHDLCDDYDTGPLGDSSRWSSVSAGNGSTLDLDDALFQSAPYSFRVMLAATATGTEPSGMLQKSFNGANKGIHCELDVRFEETGDALSTAGYPLVVHVTPSATSDVSDYQIAWEITPTSGRLREAFTQRDGGTESGEIDFGTLPAKQWQHVALDVDATQHQATFSVDGQVLASGETSFPADNASTQLSLGLHSLVPTGAWVVLYDNTFCDLHH